MSDDDLRSIARQRLEKKAAFWKFLGTATVVSLLVTAVWAMTGADSYFWPIWPMFGLAIGLVFSAIGAFGPGRGYVTEDRIDAEMRRMTGR